MTDTPITEEEYDSGKLSLTEAAWWLFTFFMGMIGALCGACGGWLAVGGKGGMEVLIGAGTGFATFFFLGFIVGPFHVHGSADKERSAAKAKLLDADRHWGLGVPPNRDVPLLVTIHFVRNVPNADTFMSAFVKKKDCFIQINCGTKLGPTTPFFPGGNPPKRTCVHRDGIFEETFLFQVGPKDDTFIIGLYDQDTMGDDLVGEAVIDITKEILKGAFPQKQGFKLTREEGMLTTVLKKAGTVVCSFAPGEGFPPSALQQIQSQHPVEYLRFQSIQQRSQADALNRYGKTSYGTLLHMGHSSPSPFLGLTPQSPGEASPAQGRGDAEEGHIPAARRPSASASAVPLPRFL